MTPRRLGLQGELTIITAAERTQEVLSALGDGTDLEVDLSAVTDLDTAGLQVLLLAGDRARRLGVAMTIREPSRAVRDVLAVAHLDAGMLDVVAGARQEA